MFTAIGILFCLLWTMTVVPAALVLSRPRGFHRSVRSASAPGTGILEGWDRLAGFAARRSGATLTVVALLLALTPLGIRRLVVQDSWIGGFARDSEFFRATQYFNQHFFGTHMLLLALDTGHIEIRGTLTPADHGHERTAPASGDLVPIRRCSWLRAGRDPAGAGGATRAIARPGVSARVLGIGGRKCGTARRPHGHHDAPVHGSALFLLAPASGETLRFTLDPSGSRFRKCWPGRRLREVHPPQTQYTVGGVLGPADQIETAGF